jgi:hypothetical protein
MIDARNGIISNPIHGKLPKIAFTLPERADLKKSAELGLTHLRNKLAIAIGK